MRTTFIKSLLISSTLVLAVQQNNAEQFPNFNIEPPIWGSNQAWGSNQVPIAWGDCIPVPVVPIPFPQNNISMPMNQQPMGQPFSFPSPMAPMNVQPTLPPPSPFFNAVPNSVQPPILAPIIANAPQATCDDTALKALQARYDQGATASKTKIAEITQALNDSNHQMTDARVIIDKLTKQSNGADIKRAYENTDLKKQVLDLSNTNKSLQAKLATAESSTGDQARKITILNQSAAELVALQSAYKTRNNQNSELKKQLAELNDKSISLQTQLTSAESNAGSQARKLTVLGQAGSELVALKSAYKSQNDENAQLKKQLAELDNNNKSMQTQLSSAELNAGAQARKLTALSQSGPELVALKSAYKSQNDENAQLKKQLAELDNSNKSLQTQLSSAESNAGAQARKLTALGQSGSELVALKSAYKERSDESAALKMKLGELDNAYKKLQTQLAKAQSDASTQTRKLTVLGQSATELTAIQSAFKVRGEENAKLKKMLADLDNSHKSLQAQFSLATKDASAQARKLTVLGQSATELTAIQSAYKTKVNENIALKTQLAEFKVLEAFANSCRSEVSDLGMKLTNTDNKRKTLLGKIAALENTTSSQTRKIAALNSSTNELDALKSAYKDLSSKKVELTSKLTAATADTDGDGVLDSSDKCPFSLAGVEVNTIGCLADADNDGVSDSNDECPASPINSHVNEKGCPKIVDTDGDTVADAADLCPSTPADMKVNEFGCEPTENITLKGVNFTTGSARLTPNSIPVLTVAAETLNKNPNLNIEISGYTDNQGLAYINKRLSQRRANTVMIQLIKDGVDANRLKAKGYGEKNPIASNRTANGRATNRRVELKIRK